MVKIFHLYAFKYLTHYQLFAKLAFYGKVISEGESSNDVGFKKIVLRLK